MSFPKPYLTIGAVVSLSLAVLHLYMVFKPQIWRYFGAGELSMLAEQGVRWIAPVTFTIALVFVAWGLYALSGAGFVRSLPLLKTVLIGIGTIYVLRGLAFPGDVVKAFTNAYSLRFAVFSAVSLLTGLIYMGGAFSLD